jgi:hypothetical protein
MLLDAYEKVIRIRKMKAELSQIGASQDVNRELDREVISIVEKSIEGILEFAGKRYVAKHKDAGRANELLNALKIGSTILASKIDNGYRIEARVELVEEAAGQETDGGKSKVSKSASLNEQEVEELRRLSEKARHFKPIGEPVLSLPKQQPHRKPRNSSKSADKKSD